MAGSTFPEHRGYNKSVVSRDRISLKADGLELIGRLYTPSPKEAKTYPALCLCHGIPAGPPDPSDAGYPALAERFCAQGFVVLIFNFRGTGASQGNFDILGWCRDLAAAIDYLYQLEEVDKSRLSLMGFSGGAAVSVYVAASDNRVSSIVTCACPAEFSRFRSPEGRDAMIEQSRRIGTIKDSNFPPSLEEWAHSFEIVSPINWVHKISPRPILIVHGDSDDLIEPGQALRLYQRAGEPKELFLIQGAGHKLRTNEMAVSTALSWLKTVNNIPASGSGCHGGSS
jgi:dipeptidyl aminopeptidase/acylaminoacyl peptidase